MNTGLSGGVVAVGGIDLVTGAAVSVSAGALASVPGYFAGVASRRLWDANRVIGAFHWFQGGLRQSGAYSHFQCVTSYEAEPNDTLEQARWLQLALAALQ